jgi:hypothetical protein
VSLGTLIQNMRQIREKNKSWQLSWQNYWEEMKKMIEKGLIKLNFLIVTKDS